jgi:hypothetical protein
MGLERTHAEFCRQGESLPVVMFSRLSLRGSLVGSDLPEQSDSPGFVRSFLPGTAQLEGTLSQLRRFIQALSQQIRLT